MGRRPCPCRRRPRETRELDIYRGYLRNDPLFDRTNTDAIMPHLPCPELDEPTLMKMARFAIEHNFGSVPPPPAARAKSRPVADVVAT